MGIIKALLLYCQPVFHLSPATHASFPQPFSRALITTHSQLKGHHTLGTYNIQADCTHSEMNVSSCQSLIDEKSEHGRLQQSLGTQRQGFSHCQHTLCSYHGSGSGYLCFFSLWYRGLNKGDRTMQASVLALYSPHPDPAVGYQRV